MNSNRIPAISARSISVDGLPSHAEHVSLPVCTNRVLRYYLPAQEVTVLVDTLKLDCIPNDDFLDWVDEKNERKSTHTSKKGSLTIWTVPDYGSFRSYTYKDTADTFVKYEFNAQEQLDNAQALFNTFLTPTGTSRIDIALDYSRDLSGCLYDMPRVKRSFFKTATGRLETINLGSRRSEKFWRVYDKAAESRQVGPKWRHEVEYKPRKSIVTLPDDLFDELSVSYLPPMGELDFRDERDLLWCYTNPGAYRSKPDKTKKRLKRLLETYLVPLEPSPAEVYKAALPSLQSGLDALLGHDSTLSVAS